MRFSFSHRKHYGFSFSACKCFSIHFFAAGRNHYGFLFSVWGRGPGCLGKGTKMVVTFEYSVRYTLSQFLFKFSIMPKKISFEGVRSCDLNDCVINTEGRYISEATKRQYESKIRVYVGFLQELSAVDGIQRHVLPLNVDLVKQCFAFLAESKQVEKIGYFKGLLASLRNYARLMNCSSVECIDTENVHTSFGRFWVGLQKTIPEQIPTPKKALSIEILRAMIDQMVQEVDCSQLVVARDTLLFLFCFLGVQRAGCVCGVNLDNILVDIQERRLSVDIYKGKSTKMKGKRFFVDLDQPNINIVSIYNEYRNHLELLYSRATLTEDEKGKKFFVTYDKN